MGTGGGITDDDDDEENNEEMAVLTRDGINEETNDEEEAVVEETVNCSLLILSTGVEEVDDDGSKLIASKHSEEISVEAEVLASLTFFLIRCFFSRSFLFLESSTFFSTAAINVGSAQQGVEFFLL
jgi:hypothetical protein